jgi:hypothetical protein
MKKITILLASIFSMAFIIPSIADEKKESIEQKKTDDAMEKEMGHEMKHHRMKHHEMDEEKKDDSKKDNVKKEGEKN